ncbi:hypothetical protein [Microvirga sp. VF16]|uniref:hypothetical protein n=1 Tax=Microvirga sp. VF16 TaxID=2807101 RepID=UPI00193DCF07|nr:hypothetical protein [Microvirga sp. VF16]QRM32378.1 hypothetical protein JO965_30175 [Microvirga sp. VF16]
MALSATDARIEDEGKNYYGTDDEENGNGNHSRPANSGFPSQVLCRLASLLIERHIRLVVFVDHCRPIRMRHLQPASPSALLSPVYGRLGLRGRP